MNKIYENYTDQHVCGVIVYGKTADHKLYGDSAYSETLTATVIGEAFKKGVLIVYDGTSYLRPVKFANNKVTTYEGTTTVTGTEWSASATE